LDDLPAEGVKIACGGVRQLFAPLLQPF